MGTEGISAECLHMGSAVKITSVFINIYWFSSGITVTLLDRSASLILLLLTFSHLADAFIQSNLQIRKSNYNYKLKLYKYYIYTFKKMEKLNKMTNAYNISKLNI